MKREGWKKEEMDEWREGWWEGGMKGGMGKREGGIREGWRKGRHGEEGGMSGGMGKREGVRNEGRDGEEGRGRKGGQEMEDHTWGHRCAQVCP